MKAFVVIRTTIQYGTEDGYNHTISGIFTNQEAAQKHINTTVKTEIDRFKEYNRDRVSESEYNQRENTIKGEFDIEEHKIVS